MKKNLLVIGLVLGALGFGAHVLSKALQSFTVQVERELKDKFQKEQDVFEVQNKELYDFIDKVMAKVKADISPLKKEILIDKVIRVSNKYFKTVQDKQSFVIILSIESKFNQESKSSVGAVGIGQLMPKYFQDFAKQCQLKVNNNDIYDIDVNLAVSACHFNQLIKENNSTLLAVAAYNAGLHSHAVKGLKKLTTINQETSNYVAKFAFVKESLGN